MRKMCRKNMNKFIVFNSIRSNRLQFIHSQNIEFIFFSKTETKNITTKILIKELFF